LSIELSEDEAQTLWKVDQKHLEIFEMWHWRRIEISWNGRVKNEVSPTIKKE
jgi:hypothetical protein